MLFSLRIVPFLIKLEATEPLKNKAINRLTLTTSLLGIGKVASLLFFPVPMFHNIEHLFPIGNLNISVCFEGEMTRCVNFFLFHSRRCNNVSGISR